MFHLLPPPLNRLSLAESSWRACQDRFRFETSESASEFLRLLSARGKLVGECRRAFGGRCSLVWQVYLQGQAGLRFSEIQRKCSDTYRLYFNLLVDVFEFVVISSRNYELNTGKQQVSALPVGRNVFVTGFGSFAQKCNPKI